MGYCLKGKKCFDEPNSIIVANIRYSDEKSELEPLTKIGVLYVKRYGCTKEAYYELNYNDVSEYGYATLGDEINESFFKEKNIEFINSQYY